MAIATRTLKDTKIATGSGAAGGKVTVLVNMNDNTTADSLVVDASGLAGHANGAKLDITRIWWALVQGTADDNTGWVSLYFEGDTDVTRDLFVCLKLISVQLVLHIWYFV